MSSAKKNKADVHSFNDSWTKEYGFVLLKDCSVCVLSCITVVCRTLNVQRHFQTRHEKSFKDEADKAEEIKRTMSRYERQSSVFTNLHAVKIKLQEGDEKLRSASLNMKNYVLMGNISRRLSSVVRRLYLMDCLTKTQSSQR